MIVESDNSDLLTPCTKSTYAFLENNNNDIEAVRNNEYEQNGINT